MSLLNQIGRQQQDPQAALQEIQRGPAAFLSRHGFRIPDNLTTPQQIIPYLLSSGQVSQSRIQDIRKQLGK